ncbi:hypothetical protein PHAVU_003G108300 [Phaseolus vulgaris]|uniref:Uncharacterized protein n=1 Tax=Phaseolus vulgaris TaxID=3885 RepID=V7CAD2_PHAVU|nr:hypothetical protein PHAVU_003G108300g [Phaseolus vulgaris]ESW26308.1 hypothetical protein PHAVU_003G108300g [Phaseolus vulgaris]
MLTNRHCKRISSSSSSSIPMAVPKALPCHDLTHLSDFDALLSGDDYISICGYGSLLSERSARSTFPNLVNFRIARLTGFRRLFNSVGAIFFTHRVANIKTEEIAGLSVEPCEGEIIILVVFEIKKTEIPAFIERERIYRFLAVVPESLDGKPFTNPAVLCASYTDEDFFKFKCSEGRGKYFERYGEYKIHKIWRDDVLPCRVYLRHCVLGAKSLGEEVYKIFLDHTFLGDRKTTIREYFEKEGSKIMEEEPPESLKIRYGG